MFSLQNVSVYVFCNLVVYIYFFICTIVLQFYLGGIQLLRWHLWGGGHQYANICEPGEEGGCVSAFSNLVFTLEVTCNNYQNNSYKNNSCLALFVRFFNN